MSSEFASYLSQLRFDPKLATSFHAKFLKNIRLVILTILIILVVGISSYLTLPRRLNPEIKIPIITVVTALPGASPEDVESLVTKKIEDALDGIANVDTISSSSQNNVSVITLEFLSSANPNKALDDVQNAVDGVSDLPEDAKTPSVAAIDFENQPVWEFSLTTANDLPTLMRFSKDLEDKIKDLPKVDHVTTRGMETQEIQLLLSPEKIQGFGLNPLAVMGSIKSSLAAYPAGTVRTDTTDYSLTLDPIVTDVQDIRNLTITVAGQTVRLSDIATITLRSAPEQKNTYISYNGQPSKRAVSFFVYKTKSANIDATVQDVRELLDTELKAHKGQFQLSTLLNTGDEITRQFTDLFGEFWTTILLVFTTMFVFLGLRQAIIVSFTVPLTFLVTFAIMQVTGLTLNFLSLFSLLLALGLLVDDAIVVVSATTAYYRTGKFTPYETGLLVWRDFIIPIWTTTISTVWAFLPLLLSTGIIGEFIKTIPIVVSASLLTSTAIAVLITLPLMIVILQGSIPRRVRILFLVLGITAVVAGVFAFFGSNPLVLIILVWFLIFLFLTWRLRRKLATRIESGLSPYIDTDAVKERGRAMLKDGILDIPTFAEKYKRLISRILASSRARRAIIIAVIIFSVFSYLLVPLGFVVNEFFPKENSELVYVSVELPPGTDAAVADHEAETLLPELAKTRGISYALSETGRGADTGMGAPSDAGNRILFTLIIPHEDKDKYPSIEIAKTLRKQYEFYDKGKFSVIELSGGPPAGADVQIKLLGEDLGKLDAYADTIVSFLRSQQGITTVDKSIKPGPSKLIFAPDLSKLAQNGIGVDTIGGQLRLFASGLTVDDLKIDNETHDIVIRSNSASQYADSIGRIQIPTQNGAPVPLLSLGTLRLESNPTVITREKGKRTISVSAGVEQGYSISTANKALQDYAKTMQLDPGYEWTTGGVNEENQKSVQSILMAMVLATILIFGTMVVQFTSFRKAVIVLLVIPLAISGVFIIFAITGTPLSFPALIGVLALYGIVVNNSMMIVDKITRNVQYGMTLQNSIADACASRVEPILLTKIATIMGLLPVTLSDPLWQGLGGAIISGLLFSSSIMLFFIPVVYYQWYKGEE